MIKIIPVEYGKSVLPESAVFCNGKKDNFRPIVFKIYLIKINDKFILVDAGCETMPGFKMEDFIGTGLALNKINVTPEDITDVIITHSHHDHIECVKYFKNATIHIQEDEYQNGKKYIPDNFKINLFSTGFLLYEKIRIVKIGGHSVGSCVVEIENDDNIYVIVGDECYLKECLDKKIPTGSFYNKEKSEEFIKKYSDKKYVVLMCHDE